MADKKITQLPSLSFISGSTTGYYAGEVVLPIVHNSTTVKIEAQKFALYATQWSATTASNTFIGNQTVNGNVVITGKLTAQEMHTELTSASIIFESGSSLFGNSGGSREVYILTARAAERPVSQFIKDLGIGGVKVIALGDNNPEKKADWIEDKVKEGYDDIFFVDDSPKNIDAVRSRLKNYNIKQKIQQVKHF